jgi:hypothetical protein
VATPPATIVSSRFTASELCSGFPKLREAIIEGLLRRGEIGNLISGPKAYKSWLLLCLAVCVAMGWPWLGFPTRKGRVLLIDWELAPGTLGKRIQAVCNALGITPDDLGDRLVIETVRGRRLDIHGLGPYFDASEPGEFELVILDPLYKSFPRDMDENSNVGVAEIYAILTGYSERLDAGFMVCHHATKGSQADKSITDVGSGAGSQSRAADCHLAIRPHAEDGAAVLGGVVRSFPPFDQFAIRWQFPLWTRDNNLDPAKLWRPSGKPKAKEPQPVEPSKPDYDIPGFAAAFLMTEPQPKADIVDAATSAGLSERRALILLAATERRRLAFRWRLGKSGRVGFANVKQSDLSTA